MSSGAPPTPPSLPPPPLRFVPPMSTLDGDQPQPCTSCQGTGDSEPAPIDCVSLRRLIDRLRRKTQHRHVALARVDELRRRVALR